MDTEKQLLNNLKKRRRRRITVSVCAVLMLAVILAGPVLSALKTASGEKAGTVTVEIRYDGLAAHPEKLGDPALRDALSDSGVMLGRTEFDFTNRQTVLDALEGVLTEAGIRYETKASGLTSVYVKGIGDLYERDAGRKSGWVYTVNGRSADKSASDYKLSDGDVIVWYFTYDYDEDKI